jgi:hypothetical protein
LRQYGFKVSARLCGEHERLGVSLLRRPRRVSGR